MNFDQIALIVSIASIALLFGAIFLTKFIKNKLRKNQEAYDQFHSFTKKLDDFKIPTILLVVSGGSFLIWNVTRVVISYL